MKYSLNGHRHGHRKTAKPKGGGQGRCAVWPQGTGQENGSIRTRSGTAFFLQTSEALFGLTAAHVIEGRNGWRAHCDAHGKTNLRLGAKEGGSVAFDWDARCVDINLAMDIATFMVSPPALEIA
jgi:hypothetical protein